MNVTIQLDAASVRQFARNLGLAAKEIERAMAKAINRTAFEILEAERSAARGAFPTASQRGREFLSGRLPQRNHGNPQGRGHCVGAVTCAEPEARRDAHANPARAVAIQVQPATGPGGWG